MRFTNNIAYFCSIDWSLVSIGKACDGPELSKGLFDSITDCARACKELSTLFTYGDGSCSCELKAKPDGTCSETTNKHLKLYRNKLYVKGKSIFY